MHRAYCTVLSHNKPEEKERKADSEERWVLNVDYSSWTRMLPIRAVGRPDHDSVTTICFQKRIVIDAQGVLFNLARND